MAHDVAMSWTPPDARKIAAALFSYGLAHSASWMIEDAKLLRRLANVSEGKNEFTGDIDQEVS